MTQTLDTYLIRAKHLLTMPEQSEDLAHYDPSMDLVARDAKLTGLIEDGGVLVDHGKIAWFGPFEERPKKTRKDNFPTMHTGVCTPGLIDCHTHAVFAGERSHEFMMRNAGKAYVEILEAGGGILNTMEAVRRTKRDALMHQLLRDCYEFMRRGVTTIEVKSGYGLDWPNERKQLQAINRANAEIPCELIPCFLGAHAIPPKYKDNPDAYVDIVCEEMIPKVAEENLATYCDVFCDRGAFTVEQARKVLETGKKYNLTPRIHADEIVSFGATRLAAEVGATSADHLEHTPDDELKAMVEAGVTGVLMPAVNLYLGTLDTLAPARKILNLGGEIALATDYNPGSAMTYDMGTVLTLGTTLYKLTPGEALRAATIGAAKALGRTDIGRIRKGARADLTLFDAPSPAFIPYHLGASQVEGVIINGVFVYWTEAEDF